MNGAVSASWALLAASVPALAQNNFPYQNYSGYAGCMLGTAELDTGNSHFNATKSVEVSVQPSMEDWYLSIGLRDTRRENGPYFEGYPTEQYLEVMLSVPEAMIGSSIGNSTEYCLYRFPAYNETVDGEDETGSCRSMLSDGCIRAIQRNEGLSGRMEDGRCPEIDVEEACGFNPISASGSARDLSNGTCSIAPVPNIDLPDSYGTFISPVSNRLLPADDHRDDFEQYDLRLSQHFPILLAARWSDDNGQNRRRDQLFCLRPDEIVEGSREPEDEEDTGVSVRSGHVALISLAAALAMEVLDLRLF